MLHICNFSKNYGNLNILNIPELSFEPGAYWIKGDNGSGKTSLFRSIAGIVPFEGEISLHEVNQKKHPVDYRLVVNYSDAEPLYPDFITANDLIGFIGIARQASRKQQNDLTSTFGITSFLHQPFSTYSSGMLKKVSLALAFFGTPSLIILDEPFITIDDSTRVILLNKIHEMLGKGVTLLISSHESLDQYPIPLTQTFRIANKTLLPA